MEKFSLNHCPTWTTKQPREPGFYLFIEEDQYDTMYPRVDLVSIDEDSRGNLYADSDHWHTWEHIDHITHVGQWSTKILF